MSWISHLIYKIVEIINFIKPHQIVVEAMLHSVIDVYFSIKSNVYNAKLNQ